MVDTAIKFPPSNVKHPIGTPEETNQVKKDLKEMGCGVGKKTGAGARVDSQKEIECKSVADKFISDNSLTQTTAEIMFAADNYCGRNPDVRYTFAGDSSECFMNVLKNPENYKQGQKNTTFHDKRGNVVNNPPYFTMDLNKATAAVTGLPASLNVVAAAGTTGADILANQKQQLNRSSQNGQPNNQQSNSQGNQSVAAAAEFQQPLTTPPAEGNLSVEVVPSTSSEGHATGFEIDGSLRKVLLQKGDNSLSFTGHLDMMRVHVLKVDPQISVLNAYYGGDLWVTPEFFLTLDIPLGDAKTSDGKKPKTTLAVDLGNMDADYGITTSFGIRPTIKQQAGDNLVLSLHGFWGARKSNPFDPEKATFAEAWNAVSLGGKIEYDAAKAENSTNKLRKIPLSISASYARRGNDSESESKGAPIFWKLAISGAMVFKLDENWTATPSLSFNGRWDTANDRSRLFYTPAVTVDRAMGESAHLYLKASAMWMQGTYGGDQTHLMSNSYFNDSATGDQPGSSNRDITAGANGRDIQARVGIAKKQKDDPKTGNKGPDIGGVELGISNDEISNCVGAGDCTDSGSVSDTRLIFKGYFNF